MLRMTAKRQDSAVIHIVYKCTAFSLSALQSHLHKIYGLQYIYG